MTCRWATARLPGVYAPDVTTLPARDVSLDTVNQTPPEERHLAVHDQHLIAPTPPPGRLGSWQAIPRTTLTGTAHDIGRRVRDYAAAHAALSTAPTPTR